MNQNTINSYIYISRPLLIHIRLCAPIILRIFSAGGPCLALQLKCESPHALFILGTFKKQKQEETGMMEKQDRGSAFNFTAVSYFTDCRGKAQTADPESLYLNQSVITYASVC